MNSSRNEMINTLAELINIDSVLSHPQPNMPFGEGVYKALKYTLEKGKELGFETNNFDNYIGSICFGESEQEVGILCHIDVVPAGNNWTKQPFKAIIENGKLFGRGTMDDKGPLVSVLYAMKELKDDGFVPSKKICLIVGCDEETSWRDIAHYVKCRPMCDIGFSPDGDFPVINCEKGILHFNIVFELDEDTPYKNIIGGSRANVVADKASFSLCISEEKAKQLSSAYNLTLTKDGELFTFSAKGKGAHASKPHTGDNAFWKIFNVLAKLFKDDENIEFIANNICCGTATEKLNINYSDAQSGALTINIGTAEMTEDKLILHMDVRYPVTFSGEQVLEELNYTLPYSATAKLVKNQTPLFIKPDNPLVIKLLCAFREVTGMSTAKPKAIGGGTFARALKCGVAFGPYFDGDEDVLHQADEYITIERFNQLVDIYKRAIVSLCTD